MTATSLSADLQHQAYAIANKQSLQFSKTEQDKMRIDICVVHRSEIVVARSLDTRTGGWLSGKPTAADTQFINDCFK
jgi:hypothetical protein